jgi:nucleotide-binding universal stress UspA family protein
MRKGILVPFDGSENAMDALKEAIVLGKATGEKVILLNVQPTFHTAHTKMFFGENEIREYQAQLFREEIEPAVKVLEASGVQYATKMRTGIPKEQIVLEAAASHETGNAEGVRWIVMGSRGLNAVMSGIMGSTSYGVLHGKAACPVMIVPSKVEENRAVVDNEMP